MENAANSFTNGLETSQGLEPPSEHKPSEPAEELMKGEALSKAEKHTSTSNVMLTSETNEEGFDPTLVERKSSKESDVNALSKGARSTEVDRFIVKEKAKLARCESAIKHTPVSRVFENQRSENWKLYMKDPIDIVRERPSHTQLSGVVSKRARQGGDAPLRPLTGHQPGSSSLRRIRSSKFQSAPPRKAAASAVKQRVQLTAGGGNFLAANRPSARANLRSIVASNLKARKASQSFCKKITASKVSKVGDSNLLARSQTGGRSQGPAAASSARPASVARADLRHAASKKESLQPPPVSDF